MTFPSYNSFIIFIATIDNKDIVQKVPSFTLPLKLLLPFYPLGWFIFFLFSLSFRDSFSLNSFIRTTLLLDESVIIQVLPKISFQCLNIIYNYHKALTVVSCRRVKLCPSMTKHFSFRDSIKIIWMISEVIIHLMIFVISRALTMSR